MTRRLRERLGVRMNWRRTTILAFAGIVTAMLWTSVAVDVISAREEVVSRELTSLANLARSFEEHTIRVFESADLTLLIMKRLHERGESIEPVAGMAAADSGLVHLVVIADRHGQITYSTSSSPAANIADREHFRAHADDIAVGLHVSKPVIGRQSGKWSIQLSRRLDAPDGSFGGIVLIALDPFYFAEFYRSVDLGADGVAALVGYDGTIRARVSRQGPSIGADISGSPPFEKLKQSPHGTYYAAGQVDDIGRYYGYRWIAKYGLIVAVGVAEDELLAAHDGLALREYVAAILLTAVIALLTIAVLKQFSKLQRSEAESRSSHRIAEAARAEAHAARDRLTQAIDVMSEGFALFDKNDRLVLWNRRYADSNPGIRDALAPGATFEDLIRAALRNGQLMIPEDQREAWIADRLKFRANPAGKIERFQNNGMWVLIEERRTPDGETVSFGTDITELKLREAQLRDLADRNAQLAAAVEAAHVGIIITDARLPDNPIMFVNSGFTRITGYAPDEAIGRNPSFLQGAETDPIAVDRLRRAVEAAVPAETELQNVRKDGTPLWIEMRISPIVDERGELLGFVGIQNDITARKLAEAQLRDSEEKYRSVVDSVMEVIFHTDPDGAWTFLNPAWARITGFPVAATLGKRFKDYVHPDDRARAAGASAEAGNGAGRRQKFRLLTRGGGFRWVEIVAQPVYDARGTVGGVSGTLTDVTDQHLAEERLRAAKDDADRASRAKSEFLAVMSHEIRTPLNGVLGTIGLLLETGLNQAQRRYAETAHESGAMLLAILNDILDFSKMEAGRLELESVDFRVRDRIGAVVDLLRPRALAKRIDLNLDINADIPTALRGDPGRLGQILLNLVSNAIKFTDAGKVALDVRLEAETEDGAWLHFSVSDTGVGITRADQDRLFSSFTQVDASRSRRASGTGLGLAISKKLVNLMGGVIGVESAPGSGSTFWFIVPFKRAERVPAPNYAADAGSRAEIPRQRSGRILVVDDSPTNLLVATGFLESVGFAVDAVDNGAAALVAAQETAYDLILMDISMPIMDGIVATSELRALGGRFRALPVIAMTAHALDRDRAACLEAGMSDHVAKPIDKKRLLAAVDRCLYVEIADPEAMEHATAAASASARVGASTGPIDSRTLASLKAELDGETFACLVDTFLSETQTRLLRIGAALAERDRAALAREAHSLKSSAATFGAHALAQLAASIELTVAEGRPFPNETDLSALAVQAGAACDALRTAQAA